MTSLSDTALLLIVVPARYFVKRQVNNLLALLTVVKAIAVAADIRLAAEFSSEQAVDAVDAVGDTAAVIAKGEKDAVDAAVDLANTYKEVLESTPVASVAEGEGARGSATEMAGDMADETAELLLKFIFASLSMANVADNAATTGVETRREIGTVATEDGTMAAEATDDASGSEVLGTGASEAKSIATAAALKLVELDAVFVATNIMSSILRRTWVMDIGRSIAMSPPRLYLVRGFLVKGFLVVKVVLVV